ncbi:Transporter [hydrothermal vent metagenome]|uniref:Transporter n=1 Tax=hydrothermal vent metagenome TaxID=652676 RepID=A0A1W1B996_9ZZZZ
MVEIISNFLSAVVNLSNAMAIYILFGLFIAGLLHELVPDTLVSKHLGKDSIGSVVKATIFGIPLPVCSCGVIPIATSIKKSGASNGATLSFLISTPITGADSILATYGMFGWIFTLYRVVTSMVISIIAGVLSNLFAKGDEIDEIEIKEECSSCCSSTACSNEEQKKSNFSLLSGMKYAFITLLGDIASPLIIGLLIGALITVSIPSNLSEILVDNSWLSYIIVITIAVPMYVCATASLPIAAGLVLAGVSPGAAFVFLSAGPATNTVTIGVVKKMLGKTTLYIYLGSIIIGSILFGLGLDYFTKDISIKDIVNIDESANFMAIASSVVLWIIVGYHMVKSYLHRESVDSCSNQ